MTYNVFRIAADLTHLAAIILLLRAIVSYKSAEGISLITQTLYLVVFSTRYADVFWSDAGLWNLTFKIVFWVSTALTCLLMLRVYARSREKEQAWKLGAWSVLVSVLVSPLLNWMVIGTPRFMWENVYSFSLVLEAFCIMPQLLLLRQTNVPTVIDSYYLVTLGSYRALYILNWIWKAAHKAQRSSINPVSVLTGVLQTAFYVDFAWVYYSRQRIKLRSHGLVDADDVQKGFLVPRVIGSTDVAIDDQVDGQDSLESASDHRQVPELRQPENTGAAFL